MAVLGWSAADERESARQAAHWAAVWCGILAGLNILAGILIGLNVVWAAFCVIYIVAAWRIWQSSRAWAIAGSVLCSLQFILVLWQLPWLWALLMPFALMGLINGVRGTAVLERLDAEGLIKPSR